MTDEPSAASQVSPLQFATFRALWIATIVSIVGTWMHSVGAQAAMVKDDRVRRYHSA